MSAKNRGTKSKSFDFYPTPDDTIRKFLNKYPLNMIRNNILEPSAGDGAISKVIHEIYPHFNLDQVEIRQEEENKLKQYGKVYIDNFLNWGPEREYDAIITNPPFTLAQEFIEKSFEIASDDTEIIMLLRLSFLESKKRHNFWKKYPVDHLYILSERPSFTGKGTDAAAYAWFVWNSKDKMIDVI